MKLIKLFILLTFVVLNVGIAGAQRDKTITVGGVSFKMIYVQGGTFQQYSGCTLPSSQTVSVGNFYIGETEVTQGLIKAVYGVYYESLVGMPYKGDNYPIGDFSWYDCQEFIEKLNKQTGLNFCLPTEEQWEFAARGGNKSRGYMFSGSNNADEVAWYWDNSGGSIHEVGSKKANELGIYDMTGNVREWCQPEGFEWSQTTKTLCGDMHIRGGDYMYVNVRDKLKVCKATGSLTYHHNLGSGFRLCLKD